MWCTKYLYLLLGAVATLAAAPVARGQPPRLLRERAYDLGSTGRVATVNEVQWLADGRMLAAGPVQLVGVVQTHVLALNGNTLDTLWTRAGAVNGNSAVRLHPLPGGRLLSWGNGFGPGQSPQWAGQHFSATGATAGPHLLPNPRGTERILGASLPAGDDDYFLAGTLVNPPYNGWELLRTDSSGTERWHRRYTWGLYGEYLWSISYTNTGTLLLAGGAQPPGLSGFVLKLLEVTAQGDSVRGALVAPFGAGQGISFLSGYFWAKPLRDGGWLLNCTRDTLLNGRRINQPGLVRLTRQLQVCWARCYSPQPLADGLTTHMAELADGSLLVLAYQSLPQLQATYELLRVDGLSGQVLQRYTFTSQLAQRIKPVQLIPDPAGGGRWLVAGSCERGYYLAHLDLSGLPSAVTAATVPAPTPAAALQVYPNPATAQATVQVQHAGTLRLLDALGRVVAQQPVRAGLNQLDVARLPAGLYACQLLVAGRLVAVQRLYVVH